MQPGRSDYLETLAKYPFNLPLFDISKIDLDVDGKYTTDNQKAIMDIHSYLVDSKAYDALREDFGYFGDDYLEIEFDESLGRQILGKTECYGAYPVCEIALNPRVYDKSYKAIGDKNTQLIKKYLQATTLLHEYSHEMTIESPLFNGAIDALDKMGYSDDNIRGFLEMVAEKSTIGALKQTGQYDLAFIGEMHSPYREALNRGNYIDSSFKGGLKGFVSALAYGKLTKTEVDEYLSALEVKLPYTECASCNRYEDPWNTMMYV